MSSMMLPGVAVNDAVTGFTVASGARAPMAVRSLASAASAWACPIDCRGAALVPRAVNQLAGVPVADRLATSKSVSGVMLTTPKSSASAW